MIKAVAFCPYPPLLIPEVAQGAAYELDELRAACRTAVSRAAAVAPQVVMIGAGERRQHHAANARGSMAAHGVQLEISLGSDAPGPVELPLPLTVGAWLLRDALGPDNGATGWSIAPGDPPARVVPPDVECSVLVMADGSARRSTTAPGYLDERAPGYDAHVADALRRGEPGMLHVDFELATQLLVGGARTWEQAALELEGADWDAELLYDAAPYGVGYFVAAWTRRA